MPVTENERKANSYWLGRRDAWRKRYHMLADTIKLYKDDLKFVDAKNLHSVANRHRIVLDSLRAEANEMMIERALISTFLKHTAYTYE